MFRALATTLLGLQESLGFADLEHLGAALGALALRRGFAVLHGDRRRVRHFPLHPALEAIGFHDGSSFLTLTEQVLRSSWGRNCESAYANAQPIIYPFGIFRLACVGVKRKIVSTLDITARMCHLRMIC